ncbi:hypothetical protein HWV23_14095 [Natronomonas halophila]|uniref:hypothetical protein n=1 Tax=Natronomonas halophila TaxID=2747817 RepID=UPI0015B5371E|nr:hypothetical protein [Natronomonas halophila]QLD86808.1 hypothetical protein HWV23_14095 [Natronomonas halophila]
MTRAVPSYRDSISPDEQAYITDRHILERAAGQSCVSPRQLFGSRHRENVIRLQCRDLSRAGLLREKAHEVYAITDLGLESLPEAPERMTDQGMFDLQSFPMYSLPDEKWRITDFSILDPPTIKQINYDEYAGDDQYGLVRNDRQLTQRRIWNIKNSRLSRLMREFPTHDPLPKQCAHWMRAVAGIHLFPDANHRTGMNTLQILVAESSCEVELSISEEVEWYVLQSKLIRHLQANVQFDTLWKRDEHYTLWHRYFRAELCGEEHRHQTQTDISHLRTVLNHARERKEGFRATS